MKIFSRSINFSIFLALILLSGQTVLSQENKCEQLSLDSILTKLKFNPLKLKGIEEINKKLISEVREQKVSFILNATNEKILKEAGADNLLIETIRQNLRKDSEDAILIYQKFVDNYQSDKVKNLKMALEAAREFVAKFETDECYKEQVEYFKAAIPELDSVVCNYGKVQHYPVNPKNELKWKLLKDITEKYKAKNWNEVFALGAKIYEIDPEFVPLYTVLASLGFDQAKLYGNKSKYNTETIFYAELAIKLMETSKRDFAIYSGLGYPYKTKAETLDKMKEILDFMKNQNLYKTAAEPIK